MLGKYIDFYQLCILDPWRWLIFEFCTFFPRILVFIEFATVNIHSLYSICRKLRSRLYLNTPSNRKITTYNGGSVHS